MLVIGLLLLGLFCCIAMLQGEASEAFPGGDIALKAVQVTTVTLQ